MGLRHLLAFALRAPPHGFTAVKQRGVRIPRVRVGMSLFSLVAFPSSAIGSLTHATLATLLLIFVSLAIVVWCMKFGNEWVGDTISIRPRTRAHLLLNFWFGRTNL